MTRASLNGYDSSFAEWLCQGEAERQESSLGMGEALSPTEHCRGQGTWAEATPVPPLL
jgi:hypothetical protein